MSEPATQRCAATIYVRDTYRRVGGRLGFKMHYAKKQCSRKAVEGRFCRQHAAMVAKGVNL